MANKQQVLDLHSNEPKLTSGQIANRLGCGAEYVRATLRRNGRKLYQPHSQAEVYELGRICVMLGIEAADLFSLAQRRVKQ